MDALSLMVNMPLKLVKGGVDAALGITQSFQDGLGAPAGYGPLPTQFPALPATAPVSPNYQPPPSAPPADSLDDDLLKVIRYQLIYTERDYERIVTGPRYRPVDYRTDPVSLAPLLMLEIAASDPAFTDPAARWNQDPVRQKYLRLDVRVENRYAKPEAEYEKRQTRALERIAELLG